ncbi:sporulation protein YunB [Sporosarcina sp. FSL K6-1522]|uniref:sporulation protein YunB n=1 Tax=Sporosarcina sp. FSL K6-1522 TaxID=2921554 RepID=UPI003159B828
MKFHGQVARRSRKKKRKLLPLLIPAFLIAIVLFLYTVNARLTPIYSDYAEVQTQKVAAHVISQAINSKDFYRPSTSEVFVKSPNATGENEPLIIDTQIVGKVLAETHALVASYLEEAEKGNLDLLPSQDNIEYDQQAMAKEEGIVFFVPIGQAANIPLLGSLGPKIPVRFHVIGDVHATVDTEITEYGINNALVKVDVLLTVNVQIVVPLATKKSVVVQRIPVAMAITPGTVPPVYSGSGDGGSTPNIEIPVQLPPEQ